jgi:D-alanine-D-alanine ligase
MTVAVLHGRVPPGAPPDEVDTLVQVEAVSSALRDLGHTTVAVSFGPTPEPSADALRRLGPAVVFNLVDSIEGRGQDIHAAPELLETLRLPYTGAAAGAILQTTDKRLAKPTLAAAGIPTPPWFVPDAAGPHGAPFPGPYIIKSVWEHGSVGLDDDAVVNSVDGLAGALGRRARTPGAPWFVERYIEGREFNLSMLAGADGPEVLPPAEMVFVDYPAGKPRIVGYRAKWETASVEYARTVRRSEFPGEDAGLVARLADLARACWRRFDLRGYARVDCRVDGAGQPWVLEVNANPCLAPDAGFAAAAACAGYPFREVIRRIMAAAHPHPGRDRRAAV